MGAMMRAPNGTPKRSNLSGRISRFVAVASIAGLGIIGTAGVTSAPAQADHLHRSCSLGPGTLAGAALGGFAGSHIGRGSGRLAATALGVFLGSQIGSSADCQSRRAAPVYHQQPRHRHRHRHAQPYYIQPAPHVQTTHIAAPPPTVLAPPPATIVQPACREFTSEAVIAGEVQQIFGTACQQSDGSWRIVSQEIY